MGMTVLKGMVRLIVDSMRGVEEHCCLCHGQVVEVLCAGVLAAQREGGALGNSSL